MNEFLNTGIFHGVTVGNTEEWLLKKLGQPTDEGILSGETRILVFNGWQFTLKSGVVVQIVYDYNYHQISYNASNLMTFKKDLNQKKIGYEETRNMDQIRLVLNSGVILLFESESPYSIEKIILSERTTLNLAQS